MHAAVKCKLLLYALLVSWNDVNEIENILQVIKERTTVTHRQKAFSTFR